jgi:hypothetical protein
MTAGCPDLEGIPHHATRSRRFLPTKAGLTEKLLTEKIFCQ